MRLAKSNPNLGTVCLPQAVIFDVDGTLYNGHKLKRKMAWDILRALGRRPSLASDFYILAFFRRARYRLSISDDVETRQYSEIARALGVPEVRVRRIVQQWLFDRPKRHLVSCLFPGIPALVRFLKDSNVKIGIYSDYPADQKLAVIGIEADVVVCSTDKEISRFKPDPKGLMVAAQRLGVPVNRCLFVGDRRDKDGLCAKNAGMPYFLLSKGDPGINLLAKLKRASIPGAREPAGTILEK